MGVLSWLFNKENSTTNKTKVSEINLFITQLKSDIIIQENKKHNSSTANSKSKEIIFYVQRSINLFNELNTKDQKFYFETYKNISSLMEKSVILADKICSLEVFLWFHQEHYINKLNNEVRIAKDKLVKANSDEVNEALTKRITEIELEIKEENDKKNQLTLMELKLESNITSLKKINNIFEKHINIQDAVTFKEIENIKNDMDILFESLREVRSI